MKPIAENFVRDGFTCRLVKREGPAALFELTKPTEMGASYEVVILQMRAAENIRGRCYPERDTMLRSESWGQNGWTLTTPERAFKKFQEMANLNNGGTGQPSFSTVRLRAAGKDTNCVTQSTSGKNEEGSRVGKLTTSPRS